METVLSVASKLQLEEYIITDGLNQEMLDTMTDYLMTLHSVSESSKYQYLERLRRFGLWLVKNDIRRFVDVRKADIGRCNATEPNKLYEATLSLRSLCKPFSDEQFEKTISVIQEELESELNWDEDGSETGCFQIAGRKILDACIDLLKRKGKIEG